MLKVTNEVKDYGETSASLYKTENEPVFVSSHWAMSDRVVIKVRGNEVTVIADDMIRAIHNATNKGR